MKILIIILATLVVLLLAAWVKLRGPDIAYETLEHKYTDGNSRFVDLPGGFHVHYQDDGDRALPPLLLLHGFGDSYTTWRGWIPLLKTQHRVISIDFPGHGLTRAPAGYELTGAALADWVDQFAGSLQLPPFAVAGNSMGGAAAWQLAVRHPQRINALILVDAAGFPNEGPPGRMPLAFQILRYQWVRDLLTHINNSPLIDQALKTDVYDKSLITPTLVSRWAEFQRAPGHRAMLMSTNLGGFGSAQTVNLGGIAVPTLVLQGENDVLVHPAAARKFVAAIPGAVLITYPQVGHLPQIEIPDRSAADVAQFLAARAAVSSSDAARLPR